MQREVRVNDTALYSFLLFEVTSIFSMTIHQNYARWMPLYSLDFADLETSQLDQQNILT